MFIIQYLKKLKAKFLSPYYVILGRMDKLQASIDLRLEFIQQALGRIESRQLDFNSLSESNNLHLAENEFRVFSQWGEDGIIHFLTKYLKIKNKVFVEFGVENYTESNTRFLLTNSNWTGLVIDGSVENINNIKSQRCYWLYNLKAVDHFITKDNVNQILKDNGIAGDIGLLSIDIDGNDYWVWEAINVINPAIVIIEYNHRYGNDTAVTIPYNENFNRAEAHYSMIYYGASIKALCLLAKRKGYAFVGCNSDGVNAFFVRKDMKPDIIKELSPDDGYVLGQFSDARDKSGKITKMSLEDEKRLIMDLPLVFIE